MPKIKEIKESSTNLNYYSANVADFLKSLSGTNLCAQIEYEPQTTQSVPVARSINLVKLKLTTELAANQKATITAFAKSKNVGQIVINEKENILLVGEFGDKEIEFAKIYELLKSENAPEQTVKKDSVEKKVGAKKQPAQTETETEAQ